MLTEGGSLCHQLRVSTAKGFGLVSSGSRKKEPHLTLTKRRELKAAEIASNGDPQWPRAEIYGDSWENGLAVGEKQKK